MMKTLLACAMLLMMAPGRADIVSSDEYSFVVSHSIDVKQAPSVVYRTMTSHIDEWWSEDHSWSGDAANFYMEMKQGGCFCERLPGDGRVEHLRLIYFAPGKEIRFDGALGPLQSMAVQGRMIWKIEPSENGSNITFTYKVFGHPQGGLAGIAPAVDAVIGEQLTSLAKRSAG